MEKIDILKTLDEGRKDAYIGTAYDVAKEGFSLGYEACKRFNELIDWINTQPSDDNQVVFYVYDKNKDNSVTPRKVFISTALTIQLLLDHLGLEFRDGKLEYIKKNDQPKHICSPLMCPFNTIIDQLAKRTKKLEFYDKQHRKEHLK